MIWVTGDEQAPALLFYVSVDPDLNLNLMDSRNTALKKDPDPRILTTADLESTSLVALKVS
jgi:hypothetical protein